MSNSSQYLLEILHKFCPLRPQIFPEFVTYSESAPSDEVALHLEAYLKLGTPQNMRDIIAEYVKRRTAESRQKSGYDPTSNTLQTHRLPTSQQTHFPMQGNKSTENKNKHQDHVKVSSSGNGTWERKVPYNSQNRRDNKNAYSGPRSQGPQAYRRAKNDNQTDQQTSPYLPSIPSNNYRPRVDHHYNEDDDSHFNRVETCCAVSSIALDTPEPKALNNGVEKTTYTVEAEKEVDSETSPSSMPIHDIDAPVLDICKSRIGERDGQALVNLTPALYIIKSEQRKMKEAGGIQILQPGLVLLKNWLSQKDQIEIVSTCRRLGVGPGGFYQPGYGDRSKLHLSMMCLGKHWNPELGAYEDIRSHDNAAPPTIPKNLNEFAKRAIQAARQEIKMDKQSDLNKIMPTMHPDICLVNFYRISGRLGLHQDKDENPRSIKLGLPVVSFSIGDAGEFLYGDTSNVESASKIILESGDVLIFGGPSRMLFHGVSRINARTAPTWLTSETGMQPGRLNLTFRQTQV